PGRLLPRAVQPLPQDVRLRQRAPRRTLAARAVPAQRVRSDAGGSAVPAGGAPRFDLDRIYRLRLRPGRLRDGRPGRTERRVAPRHAPARERERRAPLRHRPRAGGQARAAGVSQDLLSGEDRMEKVKRWAKRLLLVGLVLAIPVGAFAWYNFFRQVPQPAWITENPDANFLYGSVGTESRAGIPYWIVVVLPRIFDDLLPGPGGYASLGLPWEEGRELPAGFSKKT